MFSIKCIRYVFFYLNQHAEKDGCLTALESRTYPVKKTIPDKKQGILTELDSIDD